MAFHVDSKDAGRVAAALTAILLLAACSGADEAEPMTDQAAPATATAGPAEAAGCASSDGISYLCGLINA